MAIGKTNAINNFSVKTVYSMSSYLMSGMSSSQGSLFKSNGIVTISGAVASASVFNGNSVTSLLSLPSILRPLTTIYCPATMFSASGVQSGFIGIFVSGEVTLYNRSTNATMTSVCFSTTYAN